MAYLKPHCIIHYLLASTLLMSGESLSNERSNQQYTGDIFDLSLSQLLKIKITATKQETTLENVPGTITATTGEQLQQRDINTLSEFASHEIDMGFSRSASLPSYFMRSIGSDQFSMATDSSLSLNIDGVYLGLPEMASGLLWDTNRIETLYGPQGALYGRNATAGAVNIINNQPELNKFFQNLSATAGSYDRRELSYAINAPLNEQQAMRVSLITATNDGYVDDKDSRGSNLSDNQRAQGIRGQWLYSANPHTEFILSADWFTNRQDAIAAIPLDDKGAAYASALANNNFNDIHNNQNTFDNLDTGGWNATLNWQAYNADWTNILAWRTARHNYFFNTDGTEVDISGSNLHRNLDQWSDEIRASWGNKNTSGRWLIGANAFKANGNQDFGLIKYPLNQSDGANNSYITYSSLDIQAWSVFGEHERELFETWFIKLGLRYSAEEKQNDVSAWQNPNLLGLSSLQPNATKLGTSNTSEQWSDVTPQVVLSHNFSPLLLSYASITQGFKSGGMNSFSTTDKPLEPENVTSYELGARYTDDGRGLLLFSSAFHYDYNDLQVATIVDSKPAVSNAAKASINGIGVGLIKQFSNVEFASNLSYRQATYDQYLAQKQGVPAGIDASGETLPQTPRWQANNQLTYHFNGFSVPMHTLLRWEFRDKIYFNPYESNQASQGALNLYFARITWQVSKTIDVSLFGDNLTDANYYDNIIWNSSTRASGFPEGNLIGYPAAGRTFGASINWNFE